MADTATMRAVLREAGYNVSDRGRLGAELQAEYERITNGTGPELEAEVAAAVAAGDDYDLGVTAADFPGDGEQGNGEAGEEGPAAAAPAPGEGERRPRRVKTTRPPLRDRLRTVQGKVTAGPGKAKAGKAKPKHPRRSTDRLIGRGYEVLGRVFARVSPPMGRCIAWQSDTAGLILDDAVKGTFVDRALQPLVRGQDRAEAVAALAGPPVLIGMLQAAQGLPDDQRAIREAFLVPMLREAVALNIRVAGDKMEERMRRDAEDGPVYEAADRIIAGLFAPPQAPPSPEDAAAAAAQAMMAPA